VDNRKAKKEGALALFYLTDFFLDVGLRRFQHFANSLKPLFIIGDYPVQIHGDVLWLNPEFFLARRARDEKHEFCFVHIFTSMPVLCRLR